MATYLRRILNSKSRRIIAALLVAALLIVSVSSAVILYHMPKSAHAESTSNDILFIHGIAGHTSNGSSDTVPGGCNGGNTWGSAINFLRSPDQYGYPRWGAGAQLKTVGYYGVDGNGKDVYGNYSTIHHCDVNFYSGAVDSPSVHQTACDNYYYSAADEGTNNQDLRNLACQLAWYIYRSYAVYGKAVRVVAHSLGGLIIRYALDRVQARALGEPFPPYIFVPVVVTIATPHGGIPNPGGAGFICSGCLQGSEAQGIDNSSQPNASAFLATLKGESTPPSGGWSFQPATAWTVIGSDCDTIVFSDTATNFPAGPSGIYGTRKVIYDNDVLKPDGTPYVDCGFLSAIDSYDHGDYLLDQQTAVNTSVYYCDACSGGPGTYSKLSFPHALEEMYERLLVDIPAPSGPTNLVQNGGFESGNFNYWSLWPNTNWAVWHSGQVGNDPFEGFYFAATNTWQSPGSFYQDISYNVYAGNTFCAGAEVATQGTVGGASGNINIFFIYNGDEGNGTYFSNLPGGDGWTYVQVCATATRSHPVIRVQFYPTPNGPTIVVDGVWVHHN